MKTILNKHSLFEINSYDIAVDNTTAYRITPNFKSSHLIIYRRAVNMTRIVWSAGYAEQRYKNVNPHKVYDEMVSIGDSATPQQIVDRARDEASELHKCFTWDDTLAAENWRKQEARLIRHFLKIESEDNPNAPQIAAFHFTFNGEGYKAAEKVFKNPTEYNQLLQRAYAELHAFKEKYKTLKDELPEIFELIDELP